tara:strand:- start:1700 stop:2221 length:522 start_codon:yes stop_codon:yes gene_type:complete
MDIFIICIVVIILLLGIIGCFLPVVPGPPISYVSLLLFHFLTSYDISVTNLLICALLVIAVTVFDLWVQVYGVKKFGGTKKAINGSIIGLLLAILIPVFSMFIPISSFLLPIVPFLIILGPFLGAFIGAQIDNSDINKSLKIALGSLAGFFLGTFLKFLVCIYIVILIFKSIW